MRKIKVLILVDKFDYHNSYINGPARYFSWLVPRFDTKWYEVHLSTLRGRGRSDELFRAENIAVTYLDLKKYNPMTIIAILRLIKKKEIDVLHLTGYGASTFGRLAALVSGKPAILQEHWVDPNFGWMLGIIEKLLAKATARAIAISAYARDFLIMKKGISKEKVVLIPNGIPLQQFTNENEESGKRKRTELGISSEITTIGIVGMLEENKGHRYFIEAASYVSRVKGNVQFLIIGDGELRNELEYQVAHLYLKNFVKFVGHQHDMPAVLRALDIFVIASISESFSLSLLEAMASQRPIITTNCGGPSEIIKDTWSGIVVPVKDARSIADKILYLLDNPDVCMRLGENAKKECEKYDIEFTGKQIQDLYLEVYDSENKNMSSFSREMH